MKYQILWAAVYGLLGTSPALTLDNALKIARTNSPVLQAAQARQQAAALRSDVSGAWENPELTFEADGLGGDNPYASQGEYALSVQQSIPLGGQSGHQRAVARQVVQVAVHVVSDAAVMLETEVRLAFADALAQQKIAAVHDEQEMLGREFVAAVQVRYKAGGASELELIQAELALEEILMEKQCCFGDLDLAKTGLASLLGIPFAEVGIPVGSIDVAEQSIPLTLDDVHPALQRLRAEEERVRAEAVLARSRGFGNLLLGAGVKYEAADDAQSFVVSASIPLVFRKTGRVEQVAALQRADAVRAQREQVRRNLQRQLDQTVSVYRRALAESVRYKSRMLPAAEKVYAVSREGYEAGRYSLMELLAAQQNLASLRIRSIEAVLAAQKASAQLIQFKAGEGI